MLNQKELNSASYGEEIILFLIVSKFEIKTAKNGRAYLNLELRDQTVSLPAKIWDKIDDLRNQIKEGSIVKVAGIIEEYNGSPQIKIDKIRAANEKDYVRPDDFLPRSKRQLSSMLNELNTIISSVQDPYLAELLEKIFTEQNLDKYSRTPAGKGWHHAYIHGLLEHTLEIIRICELMCNIHPEINRDLLVCGALLHDFGKTEELTFDSVFDYSDKGKLVGHIMIGALKVEEAASLIPNFPKMLKDQLVHLVLSHQGKLEFASPVEPRTLEAIALYQADELSAKTNAYKSAIEADRNRNGNWTRFLPLANTALYIPDNQKDKNN
jgi:3'-5' exoribonuclease